MTVAAQPETRLYTRAAVAGMCVSFVLIGALQAMYGPAIPAMMARFELSAAAVGTALSAHFIGALLGVLATPMLRRRMTNRSFLFLALVVMAAGSLAFAAVPAWPLAVVAAFVIGLGFGGIDVGVNELFTEAYGEHSHGMLNLLHANFGVGALLGPLLVGYLGAAYPWAFVICGVLSLVLLLAVLGVGGGPHVTASGGVGRITAGCWGVATLFVVFYVFHVGTETGVGGWETGHLVHLGWATATAATATSAFWLAMTVTRFVVVPLARWLTAQQILLASCVIMLVGALGAHWSVLAPVAYLIVGIGVAPLFPTGLVWLKQMLPHLPNITAYVIAASMLGGLSATVLGAAADVFGMGSIPTVLSLIAAGCLVSALAIAVLGRIPGARRPSRSVRGNQRRTQCVQ